jgi:hypothetical protein
MMNLRNLANRWLTRRTARAVLGAAGALVLIGGNLGAGCSNASRTSSIDVPLEFRPRSDDSPPLVRLPPTGLPKVYVAPTTDQRTDARTIGQNTEDEIPVPVYAAGRSPADFVTDVLRQEMRSAGLDISADVSGTSRQVDSELLQFRVDESNRYRAEVRLSVKVVDPTGGVVWQGVSVGTGSNHGKSKSITNYQETFSDALRESINKILADPAFTRALTDPVK